MASAMTSRERVMAALRHEEPDRVPVTLSYGHPDDLCRHYGKPEYVGRLRQDLRGVAFRTPPPPVREIRTRHLPDLPEDADIDCWGRATIRSDSGHDQRLISPLAECRDLDEADRYPLPDFSPPAHHAHLEDEVRELHAQGLAVQGLMSQTIFEIGWAICGMERTLVDLTTDPQFVLRVFDRILEQRLFQARRFAEAGVDILRVGDDVGTQKGMMLSPVLWRQHLKPRLKRVIDAGRAVNPDVHVNYHSDGNIEPIIPELIEVGVTILNPIQPECMDPAAIKRRYGTRLTLLGAIGTQTTMPWATPGEVKAVVARRIRDCGPGGGFIIAPTHTIQPEVPWDNVLAFYEAVEEYGVYPLDEAS